MFVVTIMIIPQGLGVFILKLWKKVVGGSAA